MLKDDYEDFVSGNDTLRIYKDKTLVFRSEKEQLWPLMEYISTREISTEPAVLFDKVIGNAAALLAVKANVGEVYSPLGSELAIKTLDRYGIKHHLDNTVPYIMRDDGRGMCPMEQLSIGKEPGEFYGIMIERIKLKET